MIALILVLQAGAASQQSISGGRMALIVGSIVVGVIVVTGIVLALIDKYVA